MPRIRKPESTIRVFRIWVIAGLAMASTAFGQYMDVSRPDYRILRLQTTNGNSHATLSGRPTGDGALVLNAYGGTNTILFGSGDPDATGANNGYGRELMSLKFGSNGHGWMVLPNSPSQGLPGYAIRGNGDTWLMGYYGAPGAEDISLGTADGTGARTMTFASGGALRMKLHANGTLGVGGDLATDGFALSVASSQNYKQFRVRATGSNEGAHPLIKFSGGYNQGNGAEIWQATDGTVRVNVNGSRVGMVISESGHVGVGLGTALPQQTFHVGGAARFDGEIEASSIRTKTWTIAPDYVFEKNYKLKSLSEVDAYVQKNKRLPEVPSAKDFQEKGMDIAEMNFTLLKKVEELTLHAIRQEKEMKRQATEMRKQSEEIRRLKAGTKSGSNPLTRQGWTDE